MKTFKAFLILILVLLVPSAFSLDVTAGKTINGLEPTVTADEIAIANEPYKLLIAIKNPEKSSALDRIEFEFPGLPSGVLQNEQVIRDLQAGGTRVVQYDLLFSSPGEYTFDIVGYGWNAVSIEEGQTSYDAFTQLAVLDATWNDVYQSYWINSVDSVENDWTTSETWGYYKNNELSWCGVGAQPSASCPDGDIIADGDIVLLEYSDWSDWQNAKVVPLDTVTISVQNAPVQVQEKDTQDEPQRSSKRRSGRSSGGSSITSSVTIIVNEPEVSEPEVQAIKEIKTKNIPEKVRISASKEIRFSHDNEQHTISLHELRTDGITLLIQSNSILLNINIGQTKYVDVDSDNNLDLEITLNAIVDGEADLTVKKIENQSEDLKQITGAAANTSENGISMTTWFFVGIAAVLAIGILIMISRIRSDGC